MATIAISEIPFSKGPVKPQGKRAPSNGITIKYTADARFKERLSSSAPARTSFGLYPDTLSSKKFLLRKRDVSCSGETSWVTDQRFKFRLEESFVESYANVPPGFGWGALSQVVYKTKYSRPVDGEQRGEEWIDTVRRVVEGIWSIQWRWCVKSNIKFNVRKGQRMAQEAFDLIYKCKILPPGRVLWAVGSDIIEKKGLGAALQNCGFISTDEIAKDPTYVFEFAMDASMLGVGIGYDFDGADQLTILDPERLEETRLYVIPDSREGWVSALKLLLDVYLRVECQLVPKFDYSLIRAAGTPLKTFGGVASGSGFLRELLETLKSDVFDNNIGKSIGSRQMIDTMNIIARGVVSGNIRRSAQIAFGAYEDEEFREFKNFEKYPERSPYMHYSNNTVKCEPGDDYRDIAAEIPVKGEPGIAWFGNARQNGRMKQNDGMKDLRAKGGNPCLEQTLESHELCCLFEVFFANAKCKGELDKMVKLAFLMAKTVSLVPTHWPKTNAVINRNRRIGLSVSGVAQYLAEHSMHELRVTLSEQYDNVQYVDEIYSDWFGVRKSIKTTSVKPSGTVSLIAGATPGVHYPYSNSYIRNVRLSASEPIVKDLLAAGYPVAPEKKFELNKVSGKYEEVESEDTVVAGFPVILDGVRPVSEVSIWEQCLVATTLQEYWADNQVSFTACFSKEEAPQLKNLFEHMEDKLKGISCLPQSTEAYSQAPYEPHPREEMEALMATLKPLKVSKNVYALDGNNSGAFCDAEGKCTTI